MNTRSIITLGLLIGLMLNVFGIIGNGVLLRRAWMEAIPVRLPGAIGGWIGTIISLLSDFVFGPMLVWLYAAILPRFGPTFTTALRAAFVIWILGVAIPYLGIVRIGWLPAQLVLETSIVALVGFLPAAWLTTRFYRNSA